LSTMRTGVKALALLTGSVLALSACATSSSGGSGGTSASSSATTAPVTVTWAYEQEFTGYNANTTTGITSANIAVLNQVVRGFWQFDAKGDIAPDTEFGTYQKTSDSPLTVKYTINPKAVWSDGTPINCDDISLAWLANSGVTGAKGFAAAGTAGYEDMNKPDCKGTDQTFTITYKKVFADWSSEFGVGVILPAHIVEAQAGMTKKFTDYVDTPTSPELAKAIAFYNTGWDINPGAVKPAIMPSSGPFKIDSAVAGQSLTEKANDKWWGTPPKASTIVFRIIAGNAMAQALQNGEANIMKPQPQVDIVNQLKALGNKVKVTFGDDFTQEHLDFNIKGEFKDVRTRQAFALCTPRQQIVDNLVKPLNPNAKVMESRFIFPFQPTYADFITGIGSDAYDKVDIAKAKSLLAAAGKTGMTVRIGWRKDPEPNKRRVDTIALIQASCNQAGFKVVDKGTPTFFDKELPAANFDVALFGFSGSTLVTQNKAIFGTGQGQNPQGYTNPKVDALLDQLDQTTDPDQQVKLMKQADTILWTDMMSLPLFPFAAVMATTANTSGVTYNPTSADLTWDAYNWTISKT